MICRSLMPDEFVNALFDVKKKNSERRDGI